MTQVPTTSVVASPISTGFTTSEGKIVTGVLAFLSLASAVVIYLIAAGRIPAGTWADSIPALASIATAWITTNFASNRTAAKVATLNAIVKPTL